MPVIHDLICDKCGDIVLDALSTAIGSKCICRKGRMEIYYGNWGKRNATPVSAKEAAVVYKHPKTGKVIYPGRNDQPMPARYQAQGYERVEMRSLRQLEQFSEKNNVRSEAAWYDRGSGRGFEDGSR